MIDAELTEIVAKSVEAVGVVVGCSEEGTHAKEGVTRNSHTAHTNIQIYTH